MQTKIKSNKIKDKIIKNCNKKKIFIYTCKLISKKKKIYIQVINIYYRYIYTYNI